MEEADVVVIGAGFAGLGAAKSYLQCDPKAKLVLFDSNLTIGGVWSRERIYPDLRSNNQLGTLELPDFPMHAGFGVKPGHHIPGLTVHRYLCEYADAFDLTSRIRLGVKVLGAEKLPEGKGWRLAVKPVNDDMADPTSLSFVNCKKLIVATGLTSQAEEVSYEGAEALCAPIINSSQLSTEGVKITVDTEKDQQRITVLGGSKSGYDAVYMFASRGFEVNWIIRKSGFGPTYMAPSHVKIGPRLFWVEKLTATRFLTWFSPNLWGGTDGHGWIWRFLHGSTVGRFIVDKFWKKLSSDLVEQTNLKTDPELEKLIPDESVLWYANSLAILNYKENIHDYVRSGLVKIFRQDVSHLTHHTVNLSDGTAVPSPAGLVTATNWEWKPNLDFSPQSIHSDLGIPTATYSEDQKQFWKSLDKHADKEIYSKLPILAGAPRKGRDDSHGTQSDNNEKAMGVEKPETPEPWRLYRFLAPPGLTANGDRSLVFTGFVANVLNQVRNEVAGLWAYAYLNNKLKIDEKKVCWQAALWSRFCKRRYAYGHGSKFPDFVFEQVPFFDVLLQDLGLPSSRKSSWFKEIFEPYGQADYRGLTDEWLRLQARKI